MSKSTWLAWNPDLSRKCVLKLYPSPAPEDARRLARDMKTLSDLAPAGTARILEIGKNPSGPLAGTFVACEFVSGVSMAESRLPVKKELAILAEAADALSLAHRAKVLHRNLKPSSVLVGDRERGILVGFGVSGRDPWHYMSPEQARREKLTPASDVYSLGAILYFLLTGVPPFAGTRNFSEWLSLVSVTPPLAPSHLNREISKDFQALVFKAMDPVAKRRPARAAEFAAMLREAMRKGTAPDGKVRKQTPGRSEPPRNGVVQLDQSLEPIETLLDHAETTSRKLDSSRLEQTLKGCSALDPRNPKPLVLLGRLYAHMDRFDEAIQCLDQAAGLAPELALVRHARACARLKQAYLKSAERLDLMCPEPAGDPGALRSAREDLEWLTDRYGRDGDVRQFFTRGLWELFGGDASIGYELLMRAASLLPENVEAQVYYALACLKKGEILKAVQVLDKGDLGRKGGLALRLAVWARRALAEQMRASGEDPRERYREALELSDDLVRAEPESVDAWIQRAQVLLSAADSLNRLDLPCTRQVREALEITRRMTEKHPEIAAFYDIRGEIRRTLADTWRERGEPVGHLLAQAVAEYRRALAADPRYVPGMIHLASALLFRARLEKNREDLFQEALQLCLKAREIQPAGPLVQKLAAECQAELDKAMKKEAAA